MYRDDIVISKTLNKQIEQSNNQTFKFSSSSVLECTTQHTQRRHGTEHQVFLALNI
jgi:hypothetical protein